MQSGIRDNHQRGTVAAFLREKLDEMAELRFLFGDPQFHPYDSKFSSS